MLDVPPVSMNPRSTVDAVGQRLNALIFGALTRIDENLDPKPDLAESWHASKDGLRWIFRLRPGAVDQERRPIDAAAMRECLENYRTGTPLSPYRGSFPNWTGTSATKDEVVFELKKPDPYLPRNSTLLRYFRKPDGHSPCEESKVGSPLIASGRYRPTSWALPEDEITLLPTDETTGDPPVRFVFVRDYTTMVLKLLRGDVDATFNALSPPKTKLVKENYSDRFNIVERDGAKPAYLAFNLRDPLLSRHEVRRAIALATDRDSVIRNHLFGTGSPAGSFLSPQLPDAWQAEFKYDPAEAERVLDGAGLRRGADGTRFELHYKASTNREGIETAQIFQSMLERIGIGLVIDVVEPAVFFASIKAGRFQLYSSRWLGVADGSIFYRTLYSKSPDNRVGYRNEEVDRLLEKTEIELDPVKRKALLKEIQIRMGEDLPYFPLWNWNNTLVTQKNVRAIESKEISLSGALEPLTRLRLR